MRKVSFTINFSDRVCATVYTAEIARRIVAGESDPRSFAPGTPVSVTRHVSEWFGSHDDDTRGFVDLASTDIPLADLSGPTLPAYLRD